MTYYTPDEMARLNAEFARVAKLQKAIDRAAQKDRKEWDERQRLFKEQMAAEWRVKEAEKVERQAARQAELKKYWAMMDARDAKRKAKLAAKTEHSFARERRSRIDWLEVTGERTIATRQMHWERRATALAMRKAGLKFGEIGRRLDVHSSRARQMVDQAEREHGKRSPGEVWMGEMKVSPDLRWRQAKAAISALWLMPKHDPEADWIWMGLAA
jgi:hypothetical protein